MIDRSGEFWQGEDFSDLSAFLDEYAGTGYPVDEMVQSACDRCGAVTFRIDADYDEGAARRICTSCTVVRYIGDSEDSWDDASPVAVECPNGHSRFEVGVGFSRFEDGEIRWIYVVYRCLACRVMQCCSEWKVDHVPSGYLLERA